MGLLTVEVQKALYIRTLLKVIHYTLIHQVIKSRWHRHLCPREQKDIVKSI